MHTALPGAKYSEDSQATAFFEQAEQRIRSLPGVVAVGSTTTPALKGYRWTSDFTIEGRAPEDYGREVRHKEITPDYFQAMGIPFISGRTFNSSDHAKSPPTIIINEALARRYFADEDPIGKRLKFSKPTEQDMWQTIIGVVKNEKQDSLSAEPKPEIYQSYLQNAQSTMTFIVRTAVDPKSLVGGVRDEIRALDKDLPTYNIKTMTDLLYESLARERFTTLLLMVFAGLALVLASIGIYGVMSYSVTQRTHEIGIRMALGAQTSDITRQVIGQALRLTGVGVALGLVAAFGLTRLMASLLYGVSTTDPLTFALIAFLLSGVSLIASYIPARRAAKVDPMIALRYE